MIKAHVEGVNRLNATLARIYKNTRKGMASLNKQAALMVIQSAAKATKPGSGSKVSTLAKKYKLRPIVNNKKQTESGLYLYRLPNGKIWAYNRLLSDKSLTRGKLTRVESLAFKAWDKRKSQWRLIPYFGKNRQYDETAKGGKIPHHGAAKAGWLSMYRRFGKSADVGENTTKPLSEVTKTETYIALTNLVEYAAKVSPNAALIGVANAEKRMLKSYEKLINGSIK